MVRFASRSADPRRGTSKGAPGPNEKGTLKRSWRQRTPVAVVFPNSYYIGMSNLAVHIIYRTLNHLPGIVCERFFLEEGSSAASFESGRALSTFSILFFTLSYELDYMNIPRILSDASIPLTARERIEGQPLIVAGGICAVANPEPVSEIFDLIIMGDIEATLPAFMDTYLETRDKGRAAVISRESAFPWVYNPSELQVRYGDDGTVASFVPDNYSITVERHTGTTLGSSAVITDRTEFGDMLLLEGTRGCPSRCPFCLLGNSRPFTCDPLKDRPSVGGHVGIIGGGISFHPDLPSIVGGFRAEGVEVHLPSLRLDKVPMALIEEIHKEVRTLTFGIEAGTERLRAFIGKPLSDDDLLAKIDAIMSIKPFNLKMYFMIGLFGETPEDLDAIPDLVKRTKHVMVKAGARRGAVGAITVHASPFVPKAATPFQWLPMDDEESLKAKVARLKRALAKVDNSTFTHESVKYSVVQALLARGDRRVREIVMRLASGEPVRKAMLLSPVNPAFYVCRTRGADEVFPWDFITGTQSRGLLRKRLDSSLERYGNP
jgi:radical SAM superfamily enzyme YgiQ (UPF0313 family)